jgi:hypothetical protein
MMKQLLVYLLLSVSAVILVDRLLGRSLEQLYDAGSEGQNGGDLNRYLKAARPDILVLGSSRAHHHVIPDSLSPTAYNLSHNGMSVAFQAALVAVLSDRNAMPSRTLLLHVDPDDALLDNANGDVRFLRRFYGSVPYVTVRINELHPLERVAFWSDMYRFNGMVPGLLRTWLMPAPTVRNDQRGYVRRADQPQDAERTRFTAHKDSVNATSYAARWNEQHIRERILEPVHYVDSVCRSHGIELILFTSPLYRTTAERAAYNARVHELLGPSPRWIMPDELALNALDNIDLWRDNVHLRHRGATIFSGALARSLDMNSREPVMTP